MQHELFLSSIIYLFGSACGARDNAKQKYYGTIYYTIFNNVMEDSCITPTVDPFTVITLQQSDTVVIAVKPADSAQNATIEPSTTEKYFYYSHDTKFPDKVVATTQPEVPNPQECKEQPDIRYSAVCIPLGSTNNDTERTRDAEQNTETRTTSQVNTTAAIMLSTTDDHDTEQRGIFTH